MCLLWDFLADRLPHLAKGHSTLPDTDMRLCAELLQAHLQDLDVVDDELETIDQVASYVRNMIAAAIGAEHVPSDLLQEGLSKVALHFPQRNIPPLSVRP